MAMLSELHAAGSEKLMVLDYKDVSFSFKNRKTRRRRQRLKLALLVLLVIAVFCGYRFLKVSAAIGKIQDLLLTQSGKCGQQKISGIGILVFFARQHPGIAGFDRSFSETGCPRLKHNLTNSVRSGPQRHCAPANSKNIFLTAANTAN